MVAGLYREPVDLECLKKFDQIIRFGEIKKLVELPEFSRVASFFSEAARVDRVRLLL